ncbi:MAG: PH domain-containing protein [Nocardioides sp.]
MPAGSEPPEAARAGLTCPGCGARWARGWRGSCWAWCSSSCAVAWLTFAPEVKAAFNTGQRLTLLGMGALIAALLHALGRCRVEGRSDRLIVVNGYRRREYAWAQVLAVTLPPGAPWATLDLADGTSVPAMGIQGSDGERARAAVRELRAVLDVRH